MIIISNLQADIPDETEHVLHQFTFRKDDTSTGSVSILECDSVDTDSGELLHDYRASGKVSSGSRPNVLYDTVNAYTGKCKDFNAICQFFVVSTII